MALDVALRGADVAAHQQFGQFAVTFGDGIENALGIDAMNKGDRIPAGLIKMSNGATTPAYIDRRFVLGPESAHVNISGIRSPLRAPQPSRLAIFTVSTQS